MALDQSALLELLEALKGADVEEHVRQAAGTIYQALIEAELTAVIGAGPHERTETRGGAAQPPNTSTPAWPDRTRTPSLR